MKRIVIPGLVVLLLLTGIMPVYAQDGYEDLPLDEQLDAATWAVEWLIEVQEANGSWDNDPRLTAEVLFALSLFDGTESALQSGFDYLHDNLDNDPGLLGLTAVATVAADLNPEDFYGTNLVQAIERTRTSNGLFESRWGIQGHCYAMLGLYNSGLQVPSESIRFLVAQQNSEGGWVAEPGEGADTVTTAVCIQALAVAEPSSEVDNAREDGVDYLLSIQNRDSAFPESADDRGDTGATAYVVMAFVAAGLEPVEWEGEDLFDYLLDLQLGNGSFDDEIEETAAVVPAMLLLPLTDAAYLVDQSR